MTVIKRHSWLAGTVTYVDEGTARSNRLVYKNGDGNVIMRVDDTPQIEGNRMSVRITTKYSFTGPSQPFQGDTRRLRLSPHVQAV